jgi:glutamate 5-kinase
MNRDVTVVKLGSSLIVSQEGQPRHSVLNQVAADVAAALGARCSVAIVSSGAIALGKARMHRQVTGLPELASLQAASALGQAELQSLWQSAFEPHKRHTAQILLSANDVHQRVSYINVRQALTALLLTGAIPVINENDATATDEISFGDNDVLAAQTALLLRARRLILLTSVNGIQRTPPGRGHPSLIIDGDDVEESMYGEASTLGQGGIASKVAAARLAASGGVETFVAAPESLSRLLAGVHSGTRFRAQASGESAFKLWLRHGARIASRLTVDEGAAAAIRERGASLLAVGVLGWSDEFHAGDTVLICSPTDAPLARGIAAVDASEITNRPRDVEVVHRDRLVRTEIATNAHSSWAT